ncbi:hypothetical protein V5D56_06960 [Cellulosimicrobium sp. PMB13]|uniref:hypothetical protein n=1 Tax=Cellulosimicrobium sp. PMB13 TaxID=3120158 RepID=UPI003F4B88C5
MTHDEPTTRRAVDPTTVAIAGSTTLAWYAVPDVVRPRWARALLKTAVGTAGAVLTVTSTADGREARQAVRSLRDAASGLGKTSAAADDDAARPGAAEREDNAYRPDDTRPPFPVPSAVLALGAVGGVAASVALVVAGEKWVYRRGEGLRARGLRWPHTRVGIVMGGVAVALAVAEPFLWPSSSTE